MEINMWLVVLLPKAVAAFYLNDIAGKKVRRVMVILNQA